MPVCLFNTLKSLPGKMAKLDFISESTEDLIRKHTPTLLGMGAGAGAISAVRSAISNNSEVEMNMMTNVAVDIGLFLGAGWAAGQYTRGMGGKFTNGLVLAGSLALVNDIFTAVSGGAGLMEYTESLFVTA